MSPGGDTPRASAHHSRSRTAHLAVLLIVSVLATGIVAATSEPIHTDEMWDGLFYRSMAYNLFSVTRPDLDMPPPGNDIWEGYARAASDPAEHFLDPRNGLSRQPPYVYRVVTPLLARSVAAVTGGIESGFYAISFVFLVLAGLFIGLTVLEVAGSVVLGSLAAGAFAFSPATARADLSQFMLTDPLAFCLAALAVFALVRRNRLVFFAACMVGVFNKETMVPLLACYPLSEALLERHVRTSTLLLSGTILAAWTALRALLPVPVDRYSLLAEFVGAPSQAKLVILGLAVAYGPLLVTVWRALGSRVALSLVPFALANVASMWFLGSTDRAAAMAIPFVLSMFWFWPTNRVTRLLVLAPLVPYAIYVIAYPLVAPHTRILLPFPFIVVALVMELLLLARTWRGAGISAEADSPSANVVGR
jgi:hypothetical protein